MAGRTWEGRCVPLARRDVTMSYASVDGQIRAWAKRHALELFTSQGDRGVRAVYVSSMTGECFQIWIDPPADDQICVYAACIEGRREHDPPRTWRIPIADLEATLDSALQTVAGWMQPSERFLPPEVSR